MPLHYTDYGYGDHPVKLAFQHTLFAWIPYFKVVTLAWDQKGPARFDYAVEPYGYYCAIAPMLFVGMDALRDDYDYALSQRMIAIWRRAAELLYGDYYALTPFSRSDDAWVVRQFDDADAGRGSVLGIRLPNAPEERFTAYLSGIDEGAQYRFEDGETGETVELSGADLRREGVTFQLPARSGAIWFYERADAD